MWNELALHCERPSPFQSWDFVVEWWRHFVLGRAGRATGRFQIILVRGADGRTIGIVPLFEERTKGAAGVGLRLQPFGRSYSFEAMSDEPIALFHRAHRQVAREAVKAYLGEHARAGTWDVAVVPGTEDQRTAAPPVRLSRHAAEVERRGDGAMLVPLPASWRAYRRGLSKSMRDNLSYYPKRLDREVGAWAIRVARSPAEVALATEALIALHRERSRSATGKRHCDHIPTSAHAAFMRQWLQRLARRGAVSVIVLETPAGIRAAQAFVEAPGGAWVYYSGYHEEVSRFSALTLITEAWLRLSIARGMAGVHFPPGSSLWSARWGAQRGTGARETSIYAVNGPALLRGIARRWHTA